MNHITKMNFSFNNLYYHVDLQCTYVFYVSNFQPSALLSDKSVLASDLCFLFFDQIKSCKSGVNKR